MYVLCSPCILSPALRAKGITRPSDIAAFARSIGRCKKFGIEVIPLPCPETLYLGKNRESGTFLDRLNTPEFSKLIEELCGQAREIVKERGPPLCILGVNSSPTCGVTSTYYGSEGDKPAKRSGRGVFYAHFPDIPAWDVIEFSKYRIYLAAPLFSEAERTYNHEISALLRSNYYEIYLPQEESDDRAARDKKEHQRIYQQNKKAIRNSDIIVALIDGADADSGTSWEIGYAAGLGKKIIALRTDFRMTGTHERVNLMLEQSAQVVTNKSDLLSALGTSPKISITPENNPT